MGFINWGKSVWRLLPESARRWFWRRQPDFYLARSARRATADGPVVVAGLFRSGNGIGASARATYRALEAVGLDPQAVDLTEIFVKADVETDIPLMAMPGSRRGVLILQMNAPETMRALQALGMYRGRAWRIIGYWAWELQTLPEDWSRAFRFLGEVWGVSDFVAEAVRRAPHASRVRSVLIPMRVAEFGSEDVEDDGKRLFEVLAMGDSMSSFERKNVVGAIKAFRAAFDGEAGCKLIVKTRNIDLFPHFKRVLEEAVGEADNIEVIDASLPYDAYLALIKRVDVFLSLHRAEGFGMPLAEAMVAGTAVVATGYSGNLSFMTEDDALLVDAPLVDVDDPFGVYASQSGVWADPDVKQASQYLRMLYDDRGFLRRTARRGRAAVAAKLSYSTIGNQMREYMFGRG